MHTYSRALRAWLWWGLTVELLVTAEATSPGLELITAEAGCTWAWNRPRGTQLTTAVSPKVCSLVGARHGWG